MIYIYIYILIEKKNFTVFYFSVIYFSEIQHIIDPTYYRSIFIALIYVHPIDFSPNDRVFKILYMLQNMFLHDLHVRCYVLVVLLANCYVDIIH